MSDRERAIEALNIDISPFRDGATFVETLEGIGLLIISRARLTRVLRHVTARGKRARAELTEFKARRCETCEQWHESRSEDGLIHFVNFDGCKLSLHPGRSWTCGRYTKSGAK
jgi:hypothetical protein